MSEKRGHFITFEGIEACGKSTQIRLLADWLLSHGKNIIITREPGGTEIGEQIRALLKTGSAEKFFSTKAELLLFEASRAQHVEEKILPALLGGSDVLCDRFTDSSIVYQGAARRVDSQKVEKLNEFATDNLLPDLTIIIDIDPAESIKRIITRGSIVDRIEQEDIKFFTAVRDGYLSLSKNHKRFFVINGKLSTEEIQDAIQREYTLRFK